MRTWVGPCEIDKLIKIPNFFSDYGFKVSWEGTFADGYTQKCVHDDDYEDYSKKQPSWCRPGLTYNISSG